MRSNSEPLSDDEYDQLAEYLEAVSPFDLDGVLGLLHAVAIAPGLIPPSAWLPLVTPNGFQQRDPKEVAPFVDLLFRLSLEVQNALDAGGVLIPDASEEAECESFAAGYAAGAELDPEWLGDADRWSFAAPIAYLGGRLDLVPADIIAAIEKDFALDPKRIVRRDFGGLINAAHEAFSKLRRGLLAQSIKPTQQLGARRVGRNEPCPCGSGKKYKRCCLP